MILLLQDLRLNVLHPNNCMCSACSTPAVSSRNQPHDSPHAAPQRLAPCSRDLAPDDPRVCALAFTIHSIHCRLSADCTTQPNQDATAHLHFWDCPALPTDSGAICVGSCNKGFTGNPKATCNNGTWEIEGSCLDTAGPSTSDAGVRGGVFVCASEGWLLVCALCGLCGRFWLQCRRHTTHTTQNPHPRKISKAARLPLDLMPRYPCRIHALYVY